MHVKIEGRFVEIYGARIEFSDDEEAKEWLTQFMLRWAAEQ
jgi:hypothetical protein